MAPDRGVRTGLCRVCDEKNAPRTGEPSGCSREGAEPQSVQAPCQQAAARRVIAASRMAAHPAVALFSKTAIRVIHWVFIAPALHVPAANLTQHASKYSAL